MFGRGVCGCMQMCMRWCASSRCWPGLRCSATKARICMRAKSTVKLETDSCGEQWLMAQICGQDGDLFLWREQRLVARSSRSPARSVRARIDGQGCMGVVLVWAIKPACKHCVSCPESCI